MGKLAEMVKKSGQAVPQSVVINHADGGQSTVGLEVAENMCKDRDVTYRDGAFFEKGCPDRRADRKKSTVQRAAERKVNAPPAAPKAMEAPAEEAPKPKTRSRRSSSRSSKSED